MAGWSAPQGLAVGLSNGALLVYSRETPGAPVGPEQPPLTLLREANAGINIGSFPSTLPGTLPPRSNTRTSVHLGDTHHSRTCVALHLSLIGATPVFPHAQEVRQAG